jgi:hypothetical protein
MSGGTSIRFVDFTAVSFDFDLFVLVCSGCFWCETGAVMKRLSDLGSRTSIALGRC